MTSYLKQSTSVDVGIGPFLDETDGKTAETGLTITQADIRLKKNNGNWAQKAAAQTLTHEENGWYELTLDTTDTNTLGILIVAIHESGALPVWKEYMVLPANVYDSLVSGSDALQVHTNEITNDLITAAVIADNAIDAGAIAANAITAAKIADGAIDAATFAAGAINAAAIAADAITAAKIADGAIDAATFANNSITAAALAADAVTEIQSGLATAAALDTVDNFLDTEIAAILAAVDTEIAAILALLDDARGEPGQGAPPVNPDAVTKIDYIYKFLRNKIETTADLISVYADNGTTVDHKSTISDDGTTYTRGEFVTGA